MSAVQTLDMELEAVLKNLLDESIAGTISFTEIQSLEVCRTLCELAIGSGGMEQAAQIASGENPAR